MPLLCLVLLVLATFATISVIVAPLLLGFHFWPLLSFWAAAATVVGLPCWTVLFGCWIPSSTLVHSVALT